MNRERQLSLVMIVKNEGKGLERCLRSASDIVDEIIIFVDKASTDDTKEIAKRFTKFVFDFDWCDDFSAIRNRAAQMARGQFILFLDGHEYIKSAGNMTKILGSNADGLMCTIEMENGFTFHNPRIYRNGLQFKGRVHEKLQCKNVEFHTDFIIKHDRYTGQSKSAIDERKRQRDEQVPRIMTEEWKKDHKNIRASFHLGMHWLGRNDPRRARRWFRRYLRHSKIRGERWFVFFSLAQLAIKHKYLFLANWYIERAEDEVPDRWETKKMQAQILMLRGRHYEAREYLVNTFDPDNRIHDYRPWPRDNASTWNMLGECLFRCNAITEAHTAFLTAAEQSTDKVMKNVCSKRADLMLKLA